MKRILSILLFIPILGFSQYTAIPDQNFEQALIDLGHDDVIDGQVLTTNISGITDLDVNNYNISVLTGIQDFIALNNLNCSINQLTTLDVSQNTALITLICFNNQLTSLDVSGCTMLHELYYSGNQINCLNLKNGNNTNLNFLPLTCSTYLQHTALSAEWNGTFFEVNGILGEYGGNSSPSIMVAVIDPNTLSTWGTPFVDNSVSPSVILNPSHCFGQLNGDPVICGNTSLIGRSRVHSFFAFNYYDSTQLDSLASMLNNRIPDDHYILAYSYIPNNYGSWQLYTDSLYTNWPSSLFDAFQNIGATGFINSNQHDDGFIFFCKKGDISSAITKRSNEISPDFNAQSQLLELRTFFDNLNFTCIEVDDPAWAEQNWGTNNGQWTYSTNCDYPDNCFNNSNVSGPYTLIPDPNFEQALIDLGHDDVIDGQVLTANISGVDSLYLISQNISDLTGIEDFTALTYLNCGANELTSLDVSQNTFLTRLECSSNQLINLDVSGCLNLGILNCSSNQLTSLDVSQNIALYWFFCSNNQLYNIDVTQNTDLFSFGCEANELTSLDVSQNIGLSELSCSNNQLTSLDVSQNIGLAGFWCYNNQLSTLDVNNNTALTAFQCSGNQLTNLDLSQSNNLYFFDCSENILSCLNLKNGNNDQINLNASDNPNLLCIEVDNPSWATQNWTFTNDDIDEGVTFSTNCNYSSCVGSPVLEPKTYVPDDNFEAYLEDNGMGDGIANNDSVITANINSVEELNVENLNIYDLTGIEDFTSLIFLECDDNQLVNLDLNQNNQLNFLDCGNNLLVNLSIEGCNNLTTIECEYNQLTSLDISGCNLLTGLYCNNNQFSSLDVSQNITLTDLYCANNQIGCLNLKNGNNNNLYLNADNNPDLTCIEVDDADYSNANWSTNNGQWIFSTNCNYSAGCGNSNCDDVVTSDTTEFYVSSTSFQSISPELYFVVADTFVRPNNPDCDSIVYRYNKYTYSNCGNSDTLYIDITIVPPTGTIDITNTISIYPNPANDFITINNGNYSTMTNYELRIINPLGQVVFNNLIYVPQFIIPVTTLGAEGTYFVQVLDGDGNLVVTKYLILN